jgi:Protein of unknown function (DUF1353)
MRRRGISVGQHIALIVLVGIAPPSATVGATGRFVGRVLVEWVSQDGPDRDMRLMEDFAFVDSVGKTWVAPAGAIIDGASIPSVL